MSTTSASQASGIGVCVCVDQLASQSVSQPSARASPAAAVDALDESVRVELPFRHSADAGRAEVRVPRLDAAKTAERLEARLPPLRDECAVRVAVLAAVLKQLCTPHRHDTTHTESLTLDQLFA